MNKELEMVRAMINGANEYEKKTGDKNPPVYFSKNNLLIIEKALQRLEAIDNANPSEALEGLERLEYYHIRSVNDLGCKEHRLKDINTIKQALLKAQENNSINLLMQELDCKDFAELRKYARCGYERLNNFKGSKEVKIEIPESSLMDYNPVKKYLKWEDLEFKIENQEMFVLLNGSCYLLEYYTDSETEYVMIKTTNTTMFAFEGDWIDDIQFFNDLHLERVEE